VREDILRVATFLLTGALLGFLIEHLTLGLLVGALAYIVWELRSLRRLLLWLEHRKRCPAPEAPGVFEELCRGIDLIRDRNKSRKKKLSSYLKRFQEATAALPDATVVLGPNGEIEWANVPAREHLGVRWPHDARQRIVNLVRHPDLVALMKSGGGPGKTIEIPSPVDASRQLAIMMVPYGKHQKLLVARDVTRVHRLNQTRSDFVANVSHELRTPLTVISGYIENLSLDEENCPPRWKPLLGQMQGQTQRMQEIIEELLMLSRLEQEDSIADQEMVLVPEMLNKIYQQAQALSGERGHIFYLEVDQELRLLGNEREIYSAFSNIVFNAVQYTPARGVIRMRWYRDSAGAHLEVRDTGIGIPPQHIPRLTERFYRVDRSRSRKKGGTGLGLAIVKHVLNRHKAKLHVESTVGQGSLFRCDFPPEAIVEVEAIESGNQRA
jgi:two-component system, OmpR family, phosphate regulon sensor histidine kinase PhoR